VLRDRGGRKYIKFTFFFYFFLVRGLGDELWVLEFTHMFTKYTLQNSSTQVLATLPGFRQRAPAPLTPARRLKFTGMFTSTPQEQFPVSSFKFRMEIMRAGMGGPGFVGVAKVEGNLTPSPLTQKRWATRPICLMWPGPSVI
jgi:hypothetical protein